jgi:hypothetical protein
MKPTRTAGGEALRIDSTAPYRSAPDSRHRAELLALAHWQVGFPVFERRIYFVAPVTLVFRTFGEQLSRPVDQLVRFLSFVKAVFS